MKKFLILPLILAFFTLPVFSRPGFEFGIGTGYVFYGDSDTKERNRVLGDTNQSILCLDAAVLFPMNDFLIFSLGNDAVFDFRWKGSNHIYLADYSFLAGFRAYPNLGGLFFSIDYALGRRTDFIELDDLDETLNSKWGNGFKFVFGYDFSYHLNSYGPILAASLKSMPRGGSRDNILCVSIKLTRHK
ncbi:MAG: hypothetical protein SPL22_01860 [Treponema sp.]|uniref:hypothetical protein n=1 Tax=Treponema sp. TaxID=166 RepID=UPI002A916F7B|nr:hypothetical protein [Treponema sp.]MDY6396449.1 hypothetical protein [Treponema sp.]